MSLVFSKERDNYVAGPEKISTVLADITLIPFKDTVLDRVISEHGVEEG